VTLPYIVCFTRQVADLSGTQPKNLVPEGVPAMPPASGDKGQGYSVALVSFVSNLGGGNCSSIPE